MKIFETDLVKWNCKDFNDNEVPEIQKLLKELYNETLQHDDCWHLFYEGTFSTLRFSGDNGPRIEAFLIGRGIEYSSIRLWKDSSKYVEKHKKQFTSIFHEFSELAMIDEYGDLTHIADRVVHSFFNHHWYKYEPLVKYFGEHLWEANVISENAIRRASYEGGREEKILWVKECNKALKQEDKVHILYSNDEACLQSKKNDYNASDKEEDKNK